MNIRIDSRILFVLTVIAVFWALTARAEAAPCPANTGAAGLFSGASGGNLVDAIAAAVKSNPRAAHAIACEAKRHGQDAQYAAGAGLRRAYDALDPVQDAAKAAIILDVADGGPVVQEAFDAGSGGQFTVQGDARIYLPTSAGSSSSGTGAVSPSKP